jgi:small conductance mechanosensitive channel
MELPQVLNIVTDLLLRYSFQVLGAVAILVAGLLCARVAGRFIERSLQRTPLEPQLQRLLVRGGTGVVLLFTGVLALDKFGVQVTALVAGLSVAGLAGSLAMQGVLANVAAGLTILFTRPFRVGDYIEIGSVKGQVQAIDLSVTVLRTLEESRVVVPNRRIVGEILENYSGERRVTLSVTVGYREDMDQVLRTVQEVLSENPRVLHQPAPEMGITALADSGVQLAVRPWCKAEDFWRIHYEVYRAVMERFRDRGIAIPSPQREVRLVSTAA